MTGSAYIKMSDEFLDIYDEYGASFLRGSWDALRLMPPTKEYVTNDCRLDNGVEYLGGYERYNERQLTLSILFEDTSMIQSFIDWIMAGTISLKVPTIGKIFHLLYSSSGSVKTYNGDFATVEITFKEPNPASREDIQ